MQVLYLSTPFGGSVLLFEDHHILYQTIGDPVSKAMAMFNASIAPLSEQFFYPESDKIRFTMAVENDPHFASVYSSPFTDNPDLNNCSPVFQIFMHLYNGDWKTIETSHRIDHDKLCETPVFVYYQEAWWYAENYDSFKRQPMEQIRMIDNIEVYIGTNLLKDIDMFL